jgi:regulator of ribonuclease activity A
MDLKTTDLCDAHAQQVRVVHPGFRDFGGRPRFSGAIATVRVFEDNVRVRRMLETPGNGRVLVVDGGASMRCALLGDRLAQLAADNGWVGVVINGCIRDSVEMAGIAVGVRALAVHPRKSLKAGAGETAVPVAFGGVIFNPGEYLYADEDGIVISDTALS